MKMENQKDLILRENWDILIILDDCRYDYFKEIYSDYLEGRLIKGISPASNTYGWCKRVIEKGYFVNDIVVSANPHINSYKKVRDFNASKYFHRIVDVWSSDWDEDLPTVRPDVMTERIMEEIENHDERRIIAWYIQPHFPSLSLEIAGENPFPSSSQNNENNFIFKLRKKASQILERSLPLFLLKKFWQFRLEAGGAVGPDIATFAQVGVGGMKEGYKDNLRRVLESTSKLIKNISNEKVVVITSDHGERLGEGIIGERRFGHPADEQYKELIEVPWLEVKKDNQSHD